MGERKPEVFADGCQLVYPFTVLLSFLGQRVALVSIGFFGGRKTGVLFFRTLLWHACIVPRVNKNQAGPTFNDNLVWVKSLSRVRLFATPWTVAYQASPSMGFSRQKYWSGLPFPSPGDLPDPGIEPGSPALEADALTSEPPGKPIKWVKIELSFILRNWTYVVDESLFPLIVENTCNGIYKWKFKLRS